MFKTASLIAVLLVFSAILSGDAGNIDHYEMPDWICSDSYLEDGGGVLINLDHVVYVTDGIDASGKPVCRIHLSNGESISLSRPLGSIANRIGKAKVDTQSYYAPYP